MKKPVAGHARKVFTLENLNRLVVSAARLRSSRRYEAGGYAALSISGLEKWRGTEGDLAGDCSCM